LRKGKRFSMGRMRIVGGERGDDFPSIVLKKLRGISTKRKKTNNGGKGGRRKGDFLEKEKSKTLVGKKEKQRSSKFKREETDVGHIEKKKRKEGKIWRYHQGRKTTSSARERKRLLSWGLKKETPRACENLLLTAGETVSLRGKALKREGLRDKSRSFGKIFSGWKG